MVFTYVLVYDIYLGVLTDHGSIPEGQAPVILLEEWDAQRWTRRSRKVEHTQQINHLARIRDITNKHNIMEERTAKH